MINEIDFEIDPGAFESKRYPLDDISVNWLEFFGQDLENSLLRIRKTHSHQNLQQTGRFIKLNVGKIKEFGREHKTTVHFSIYHSERKPNVSHASIHPPGKASFSALALCSERHGELLKVPKAMK